MQLHIETKSSSNGVKLVRTIKKTLRAQGHNIVYTEATNLRGRIILNVFASKLGGACGSAIFACRAAVKRIHGRHTTTCRF